MCPSSVLRAYLTPSLLWSRLGRKQGALSTTKYKPRVFCFAAHLKQHYLYNLKIILCRGCFALLSPHQEPWRFAVLLAMTGKPPPSPGAPSWDPRSVSPWGGEGGCSGAAEPLQLPPPPCPRRRATDSQLQAKAKSPAPGPPAP